MASCADTKPRRRLVRFIVCISVNGKMLALLKGNRAELYSRPQATDLISAFSVPSDTRTSRSRTTPWVGEDAVSRRPLSVLSTTSMVCMYGVLRNVCMYLVRR
ncbi:hypothetical protein BDV28DRAFT_136749 [Aspergillus coremiiformis]|uniref:Uncharacterized protein n=1 Tax=Aspergillus coremiiformis TaxID=138285 RepID=A0A5N6Z1U6_9EURO|nr:hypothetical protein BDV28DRAFT_136749 [Aspergillus coremiiformis]